MPVASMELDSGSKGLENASVRPSGRQLLEMLPRLWDFVSKCSDESSVRSSPFVKYSQSFRNSKAPFSSIPVALTRESKFIIPITHCKHNQLQRPSVPLRYTYGCQLSGSEIVLHVATSNPSF